MKKSKQQQNSTQSNDNADNQINDLQTKAGEYLAGWKRAMADYENLKKESARDREDFVKYANGNLLIELLPVFDYFKSALNSIPEEQKSNAWVVGFGHIKKMMGDFLVNNGVEEIKTVGEKFNPEIHEAVEHQDKDGDVIVKETKSGYKLNGKVIQVAKVVVGK